MSRSRAAAQLSSVTTAVLRFADWQLDPRERLLKRGDTPVVLRARAFDLLCVLASRPGQLVTKDELLDEVWRGLVVEENNIAAQILALRKALGNEMIATVPGRGYRFTAEVVAEAPTAGPAAALGSPASASAPTSPTTSTDPPSPSGPTVDGLRLYGRDGDLQRLRSSLQAAGSITLLGPAGVGKTTLARALHDAWPGPRHWLDLIAESPGSDLPGALCRALGSSSPEGEVWPLIDAALVSVGTLLVLDNAEHLAGTVAELVDALRRRLPGLHLVVTSQVPLGLPGEQLDRLQPLAVPSAGAAASEVLSSDAVALLADRVHALDRRWSPGPENAAALRELCEQLDGLPLALEMAAARVPMLGVAGVRDGLAQRFAMLTRNHRMAAARHRTLHAALDWSYGLLSPDEQQLLAALAVCAGSFAVELAVALGTEDPAERWDVIDRLASLVDRSLVVVDSGDPPRYRLLESVRAYALEQLNALGHGPALQRRHALAMHQLLQDMLSPERKRQGVAEQALLEMDNLRAAIEWSHQHDAELVIRLAAHTGDASTFTRWMVDAWRWLEACQALLPQVPLAVQALWWTEVARMRLIHWRPDSAEAARRAIALAREVGNDWYVFLSTVVLLRGLKKPCDDLDELCAELEAFLATQPPELHRRRAIGAGTLAVAHQVRGDWSGVLAAREREVEHMLAAGDRIAALSARSNMVHAKLFLGRAAEAVDDARHWLAMPEATHPAVEMYLRLFMLDGLIRLGRWQEALDEAPRTLALCSASEQVQGAALAALLATRQGRWPAGARLLGHTLASYRRFRTQRPEADSSDEPACWQAERLLRAQLPEVQVDRLLAEGALLDDAAALAVLQSGA